MRQFDDEKKRRLLIIDIILTVILTGIKTFLSIRFGSSSIDINGTPLHINTLLGCIQIFTYMLGIAMIFIYPKLGLKLSIVLIILSMGGSIMHMVRSKQLDTLTGPVNSIFFLIASYVVSKQCIASERRAVTDDTTGLFNSYEFEHTLYKKILFNEKGYLLIMHIDGFSQEYANLGREAGDEILRILSERIKELLEVKSQAYKLEGAEFAIILPAHVNYAGMADRLIRSIEEPVEIRKGDVVTNCYLTAHTGIAVFLDGGVSSRELIMQSDIAKNYARNSKRSKICVFNEVISKQIARTDAIEKLIKESFDRGNFYLVYQPQYTASDKKLRGYETLLRLNNESDVEVNTGELIEIAEKSELIFDIDRYVLRRAMREFVKICEAQPDIIISVNVSAKEISRAGFANMLLCLADELNFPLGNLEIEITEYSLAVGQTHTIDNIEKLRENGVSVALDDFGTGYTSLGQLMSLPIKTVKLDKSLIDNVATSKQNTDFVKSAIYMGHLLDAEVIAEGVETEEQLNMLRDLECDYIQGFLWGKPMNYSDIK